MTYNPDIHHRRSIRLRNFDYASAGAYFVTICVQGRECLLGEVADGVMGANDAGRMVESVWHGLPDRFAGIELDEFVIMPNHVHFILFLVGAGLALPGHKIIQEEDGASKEGGASPAPTLSDVAGAFKSLCAIKVNRMLARTGRPLWQRNYDERIIRNDAELEKFRAYILLNPDRWAGDEENPLILGA